MRHAIVMLRLQVAAIASAHAPTRDVAVQHRPLVSAPDVVTASAEAIGGVERLRGIRGVRVEETGMEYLVSTVTRADAPPRAIAQTIVTLRASADSSLRRTIVQTVPMRTGSVSSTIVANHGSVAVMRGNALAAASGFDLAIAEEELTLSPERALLTALDASSLRLERDTTLDGVVHHVVSLGTMGAAARLFIDAASGFPTHLELVRAYPSNVFWAMWGDLRFMTTWSAWALEPNGVWYPRQRRVTLNGAPFREYVVSSLDLGAPVQPDSVSIPDSVRSMFATRLVAERRSLEHGSTPRLTPVELGDGVVLYQGGYQSVAVRQADGVVIIEGPESNGKSRAVLADVAARWPGSRVTAVVSTSPMWMHMGGLREYAARRVPIYVLDVNAPSVRALLAAPHRQAADSLERTRGAARIRPVGRLTTLGSGATRLELRPARGQHASAMLLVWLPGQRLLYASDVVVPDAFEPVFAAAYRAELGRIVRREALPVDRVFSEHLPVMAWADVVR